MGYETGEEERARGKNVNGDAQMRRMRRCSSSRRWTRRPVSVYMRVHTCTLNVPHVLASVRARSFEPDELKS